MHICKIVIEKKGSTISKWNIRDYDKQWSEEKYIGNMYYNRNTMCHKQSMGSHNVTEIRIRMV